MTEILFALAARQSMRSAQLGARKNFIRWSLGLVAIGIFGGLAANASTVRLEWTPNEGEEILAYRVYFQQSDTSPEYIETPTSSAVLSNLTAGSTYKLWVTAVGPSGLESLPSDELTYRVPGKVEITSIRPVESGAIGIIAEGVPRQAYSLQEANAVESARWNIVASAVADDLGRVVFESSTVLSHGFYRVAERE